MTRPNILFITADDHAPRGPELLQGHPGRDAEPRPARGGGRPA